VSLITKGFEKRIHNLTEDSELLQWAWNSQIKKHLTSVKQLIII